MVIDATTVLFFDASCLIAAAGSPTGGSGFLLALIRREILSGAVSQAVLLEAERNIQAKLGLDVLRAYHELLTATPLAVAPIPQLTGNESWRSEVNDKDAHVVAAALAIDAPYLISLDRQLNIQVNRASTTLSALTPGEFIKLILPHHTQFPGLRD
jgi:predicted nucleic acid-binding protein